MWTSPDPLRCALLALACVPLCALAEDEPDAGREPPPSGALQLVDVDKSAQDRLREITQWAQEKRYDEVVEGLHALMTSEEKAALCPLGEDGRRFGTVAQAAARILGKLPDEALDLYGRRHDLAAQKSFETAKLDGDQAKLRWIGEKYFHTPHGGRALLLAAALAFDQGDHLAAASMWERLYREHRRLQTDRALLLAKVCVANQLAGDRAKAGLLLKEFKEHHAAAEAVVAGKRVPLAAFLEQSLASEPDIPLQPLKPTGDWTCFSGSPRSVALMNDCDAAPMALWGESEAVRSSFIEQLLGVGFSVAPGKEPAMAVALEAGRVRVRKIVPGQAEVQFDLPPLVHPVAMQGLLLCRREAAVVATSLESGKELWRTKDLPVHREEAASDGRGNPQMALAGDMGRYALTVGDGKVYTVCRLSPLARPSHRFTDDARPAEADASSLVALALRPGGPEVAWEIGCGKGENDSVRLARYLMAPTFDAGRLYTLARMGNRYHALCLDAAKGTLIWETPLGLVPMRGGGTVSWQQSYALEVTTERGSPPAVADGTVFFTTNAGVVMACSAATGAPLWAQRYDSWVGGAAGAGSSLDLQGLAIRVATARSPYWPVAPLVVTQGRVVCLPCDSDSVLALHAQTGELLWSHPRENQQDLTALDDTSVLLSGPDLVVLNVRDGSMRSRTPFGILGRPAVMEGSIVAAGEASFVRVDRSRWSSVGEPVSERAAVLGQMLAVGNQLIAVNAAGISCYANYEAANKTLRAALAAARQPAERASLGLRAAMLALSAKRLDDAAQALTAALEEARKAGDQKVAAQVAALLFETRMRQNDAAASAGNVGTYLDQAAQMATSPAEREQVFAAQIRQQGRLGHKDEAVRLAQAVLDRESARWGTAEGPALTEYLLAHKILTQLVRESGQALYAAGDAKLSEALDQAATKQDADGMAAAQRRWPLAQRAGEALLKAADILYRRSISGPRPDLALVAKAQRLLGQARNDTREEVRLKAKVAEAVLNFRLRPNLSTVLATELQTADRTQRVDFGGFTGTIQDLVTQATEAAKRPMPPADPEFGDLKVPLALGYEARVGSCSLLRDTHGGPVRLGERVFLCIEMALACVDAQANDFADAKLWTVELSRAAPTAERVAELSSDRRKLVVLDTHTLTVVDVLSGKVLLSKELDWLGPRGWIRAAGDRDWLALVDNKGQIHGVKALDGEVLWKFPAPQFTDVSHLVGSSEVLYACDWGRGHGWSWDVRTGRVLAEMAAHGDRGAYVGTALTLDGLVLTLDTTGAVEVHDVRAADVSPMRKGSLGGAEWRTLGVGSRFVGFRATTGEGKVCVLDLLDLKRVTELKLSGEGGAPRVACRLTFRGNTGVFLHADEVRGEELVGPGLTAYQFPEGKKLWSRALLPAAAGPCRATRLSLYGNSLALTLDPRDTSQHPQPYVVKIEDGDAFVCAQAKESSEPRAGISSSPVVLNGRVLVCGGSGLRCWVSLKP